MATLTNKLKNIVTTLGSWIYNETGVTYNEAGYLYNSDGTSVEGIRNRLKN